MFFVYGWRGARGPFYVATAAEEADAVMKAKAAVGWWSRVIAKDVRSAK
jgi:hypothetical protein